MTTIFLGLESRFRIVLGADPGFFLGGCALVSCSTSTPINHIVFFLGRIPVVLENRRPSRRGGGVHPLHPPPRSAAVFTKYSRHIGLSIPKNENNNGLWNPLLCSMQTFEAVRAILWRNLCVSRWSIPTVKGHKGHEHGLLCSGM